MSNLRCNNCGRKRSLWERFWRWINNLSMPPKPDDHALKKKRWLKWLYNEP